METLHQSVCEKFPLLVLIDLGGTIFLRTDEKGAKACPYDKKIGKYSIFFRPGHRNLLQGMQMHPRIQVAFYSSIMLKNITPILTEMTDYPELECIRTNQLVFD